jgi:hypothetical protein
MLSRVLDHQCILMMTRSLDISPKILIVVKALILYHILPGATEVLKIFSDSLVISYFQERSRSKSPCWNPRLEEVSGPVVFPRSIGNFVKAAVDVNFLHQIV